MAKIAKKHTRSSRPSLSSRIRNRRRLIASVVAAAMAIIMILGMVIPFIVSWF